MTTGTALFHALNTAAFGRLDTRISELQTRISEGTNDPRPSADLGRAARLSAAQDQKDALARFSGAVARASDRLGLTDITLAEVSGVMQRLGEIAVRGASDATPPTERVALGTEVAALKQALLDHANARDSTGRPLFAGYRTGAEPFVETADGIAYQGDGGRHRLRVSESARIDTGLTGAEVFMGVPDATGARRDVFGMIDDLARTLLPDGADLTASAQGKGQMTVSPALTRDTQTWGLRLDGPLGGAQITADLVAGALGPAVEAINAQTAWTGITAALDAGGGAILLQSAGDITLSGITVTPPRGGVLATADGRAMVADGRSPDALVAGLRAAADHIADRRAEVGAMGDVADRQAALLDRRETALAGVLSGLEDLDVAEAVTRLQELMLTRQVSQQTYVKIGQSTLFDWLR